MKTRRFSGKALALCLAVTILIGSVAVGLGMTLAATPEDKKFKQPNNYIIVETGGTVTQNGRGVVNWRTSDNAVLTVTPPVSGTNATVTGVKVGIGSVSGATRQAVVSTPYQVINSNNPSGYVFQKGLEAYVAVNATSYTLDYSVYFTPATDTAQTPTTYTPKNDAASKQKITWETATPKLAAIAPGGAVTVLKDSGKDQKGVALFIGTFVDRWGVPQTLYFQLGIGLHPSNAKLNALIDAIERGETVLKLDPNPYKEDGLAVLQQKVNDAKALLNAEPTDTQADAAVKAIDDAIQALKFKTGLGDGIIVVGTKKYRRTGTPKVYEVLDDNTGNSKVPPEYIYDPNDSLGQEPPTLSGDEVPAYADGFIYYVEEDPAGSNIFIPIDQNGNKDPSRAIWGGPDRKPSGNDNRPAAKSGTTWYAEDPAGSNIWKPVNPPPNADTLKPVEPTPNGWLGGGNDGKPGGNDDLYPITVKHGQTVAGPFNDGTDEYYIGQGPNNRFETPGDGTGKPVGHVPKAGSDDQKLYDTGSGFSTTKPVTLGGMPNPGTGRTYTDSTGATWLEIATISGYSLALRTTNWQTAVKFNSNSACTSVSSHTHTNCNNYNSSTCTARTTIESFPIPTDMTPYVVAHNAKDKLGTYWWNGSDGQNGFSSPVVGGSYNKAFLLSTQEASKYCCKSYWSTSATTGEGNYTWHTAGSRPLLNWEALGDETSTPWWLRSLGGDPYWACSVGGSGEVDDGAYVWGVRALRPALWVNSGIFDAPVPLTTPTTIGTGRTYTDNTGGKWLEIATNGGYSLALRTTNWQTHMRFNNICGAIHTHTAECSDYNSPNCTARAAIESFTIPTSMVSSVVPHNATSTLGAVGWNGGDGQNGFSAPVIGGTNSKPFLLSYQEAAKYCSKYYTALDTNGIGTSFVHPANSRPLKNWEALDDGAIGDASGLGWWWLRSPGRYSYTASSVSHGGTVYDVQNVWQPTLALRPALWVSSSLFNAPTPGMGNEGTGRKIDGGDGSQWMEIATNGSYSLFVRVNRIPRAQMQSPGGTSGDVSTFGSNNTYVGSTAQGNLKYWWNNYAGIKLKNAAVNHNALSNIGTWGVLTAANSFSAPIADGNNTNEPFLLSFQEAANYCSYRWYSSSASAYQDSSGQAYANWQGLGTEGTAAHWWLRSPNSGSYVSTVSDAGYVGNYANNPANTLALRPALWLPSTIT